MVRRKGRIKGTKIAKWAQRWTPSKTEGNKQVKPIRASGLHPETHEERLTESSTIVTPRYARSEEDQLFFY
jgi:hypothetical protein